MTTKIEKLNACDFIINELQKENNNKKYNENKTLCNIIYHNIFKLFPNLPKGINYRIKDLIPELYIQKPKKRYVNKNYKYVRPCRRLWWKYTNTLRRIKACVDAKKLIVQI